MFNGVIANTGGQVSQGAPSLLNLLEHLALEGIKKIVLIAKEPDRYRNAKLPGKVSLRTADDLEGSMRELEQIPGTTVLIYDGECANERRRRQKRGKAPAPTRYTVVNEDVCENCGDCGRVANCMSLQKVDTEFGAKTQIHQSSCNQDQACVKGECPSFVTVEVDEGVKVRKPKLKKLDDAQIPEPRLPDTSQPYNVYVPGLGGTGVITANAILAQAASLDGYEVKSYDQTGAAQKWGAVLSSLIISDSGQVPISNRVALGRADLYLALDLLAGVDSTNLRCCRPGTTRAVMNSNVLPSGDMIRNPRITLSTSEMISTISSATDGDASIVLDARRIAEGLFGDYVMANMVTIGAAHQAGLLPISSRSIEAAIKLNGTQIDANILAFRAGRLSQHDHQALEEMLSKPFPTLADRVAEQELRWVNDPKVNDLVAQLVAAGIGDQLVSAARKRICDLIDYQNFAYASQYVSRVCAVASADLQVVGDDRTLRVTEAVIRNLYKLMAYKDEYEVARLLLQDTFHQRVREMFTGPVRIVFNLQPPFLRWFGLRRKVGLGPWVRPILSLLAAFKSIRGSIIDPFGYLAVRREERDLIDWYLDLVAFTMPLLTPQNQSQVHALLSLPDEIRGYESVKSANAVRTKAMADRLRAQIQLGKATLSRRVIPLVPTT